MNNNKSQAEHKIPGQPTDSHANLELGTSHTNQELGTRHANQELSTSHANQELGTSSEKLGTSTGNMTSFIDAWKNFDKAGSHLVSSICKDLSGSQLEGVEGLLGSGLSTALFAGSGSEQVLGQLKVLESMLSSPKQDHQAKLNPSQVCLIISFMY